MRLKNDDKVIVPACTWITNISPVIQLGFQPLFCDINLTNYSFDVEHLKQIKETHSDVLARIGQGPAKPGKSAPWILLDATGDAGAVAKANAYLGAAPAAAPAAVPKALDVNGLTPEVAALLAQLGAKPV